MQSEHSKLHPRTRSFILFVSNVKQFLCLGVEMALIAMSDVVILSYGTYGDFGALLGKDKKQVLYPKSHKAHDETGVNQGLPRFMPIPWKKTK